MTSYADFHRRSIEDRDGFWAEQAQRIEWHTPPTQICDYSNPPFAKWFVGGTTNLCHNAVDRHLADRAHQNALIAVSTETNTDRAYTFAELHREVADRYNKIVTSIKFEIIDNHTEENFMAELEKQILDVQNYCKYLPPMFFYDLYHCLYYFPYFDSHCCHF